MTKVNPQILRWARESAGLTLDEAARGIGLSGQTPEQRLAEFEEGKSEPSRKQLVRMSERYRRPLLTFYLAEPPRPAKSVQDFRNLSDRDPTCDALVDALVRNVRLRQTLVREALIDADEAEPLRFVGSVDASADPRKLAKHMAEKLSFNRDNFRRARTYDDAFKMLRERCESIGIFVLLMGNLGHFTSNLSPGVFRGMALSDSFAPFIVVNENDSRSAWSFTLIHELAHIFIGQTGISGYNGSQVIEQFCDEVAAVFLVDDHEYSLLTAAAPLEEMAEKIGVFSSQRNVSRKMVAYNLLKRGDIDTDFYRSLSDIFDEERRRAEAKKTESTSVNYYIVRRHRVGSGLLRLVDRLMKEGTLSSVRAGRVLGVKPTAVSRMTEKVA